MSYTQGALWAIRHHSVGAEIDSENLGQEFHAIDDPLSPVFIAFTGKRIKSAEKSTPDAAGYTVVIRGFFQQNQGFPWFRHRITP